MSTLLLGMPPNLATLRRPALVIRPPSIADSDVKDLTWHILLCWSVDSLPSDWPIRSFLLRTLAMYPFDRHFRPIHTHA